MRTKYILLFLWVCLFSWLACKKNNFGGNTLGGTITLTPNSGLAGTIVTIRGKGFGTDTGLIKVSFNGSQAAVQQAADSQLLVVVPQGTTGAITVQRGGQTVNGPVFTFQKLSIASISPAGGPAGVLDTIIGAGLTYNGGAQDLLPGVFFNGKPAKIVAADSNQLVVVVPDTAGIGPVTVKLGEEQSTGPVFNFIGIVAVSPMTGNVGTIVHITGGFGSSYASAVVTLGGKAVPVFSATDSLLTIAIPKGDTTGQMVVSVGGYPLPGPVFTFVPPPQLTELLPNSGPAGTKVTIMGSNFSAVPKEDTVRFSGVLATVVSASTTAVTVIAPTGASDGLVTVLVNGQKSVQSLPYKFQGLGITGLYPVNFLPPANDTIRGFGFGTNAANVTIRYNGVSVSVQSIVDTMIVVSVPSGVTSGVVNIQVGTLSAGGLPFLTQGVSTFAGGSYGLQNGQGTNAQFIEPAGLAIDAAGNIYVADYGANNIRKITPDGAVSNFAGDPNGNGGSGDGVGATAQFNGPNDIAIDKQGNLYVADQNNYSIRKITPNGTVTTLVPAIPNGSQPWGVAVDPGGNIWASDWSGDIDDDYQFSPSGNLINTYAMNYGARLTGVTVDAAGNVYTIDKRGSGIFKNSSLFFSNNYLSSNENRGLFMDNSGNIIIADAANNQIEMLNLQTMVFSIIAGGANGGYVDGPIGSAQFSYPIGGKTDANGNLYIVDQGNYAIRKISIH